MTHAQCVALYAHMLLTEIPTDCFVSTAGPKPVAGERTTGGALAPVRGGAG